MTINTARDELNAQSIKAPYTADIIRESMIVEHRQDCAKRCSRWMESTEARYSFFGGAASTPDLNDENR